MIAFRSTWKHGAIENKADEQATGDHAECRRLQQVEQDKALANEGIGDVKYFKRKIWARGWL